MTDERTPEPGATRTSADVTLRLAEGTVLAGRYRIRQLLGLGGMGMVYRAHDAELDMDVAIKVLRPDLVDRSDLLERFRRELVLGRQVSHPNVVRIHDIGADGDLLFLSMDLVSGRSLRDLIEEQGSLPAERVQELGEQLAGALAAAHEQGVVHRDLKPSNVLIDEGGRAYVTDFGVARSVTGGGLTRTGAVVGTPDYLSPEQALGEAVDARSDVYALGILLFEMLSGKLPFDAQSVSESVAQRVAGRPQSLRACGVSAPPRLEALVERCLARRPERRFASGREVLEALRSAETSRPRLRAVWLAAGVAAVALAVWLAAGWRREAGAPPSVAEPPVGTAAAKRVVLLPLTDQTGRPELAWLATALPDNVARELAEDPDLQVLDSQRLTEALADLRLSAPWSEANLARLAEIFDAGYLVDGSLRSGGEAVSVDLQIHRPGSGARPEVVRASAPSAARSVELIDAAVHALRSALEVGGGSPTQVSSRDPTALKAYSEGSRLLAQGNAIAARPELESAVAADPAFGAAWLRLSEAYADLGQFPAAEEAATEAVTAFGDSTSRMALEARASRAMLEGDPEAAGALLEQLAGRYPKDAAAVFALGEAYGEEGKLAEGMEALNRVVTLAPNHGPAWYLLGKYSILSGDPQRAVDEFLVRALVAQNRARNLQGQADALNAFGIAYRQLGDLALAAENYGRAAELREKIGDRRGVAGTLRNLAHIHISRGDYGEAEANLHEALEIREELGDQPGLAALYNDLGVLAEDRGQYGTALEEYRQALRLRRELGDQRLVAESLNNVGFAKYLLGDFDDASVYWREAERLYAETGDAVGAVLVQQSLAQLHLARGEWDVAARVLLDTLQRSRELEFGPAVATALGYLGRLAHCQGRLEAALGSYGDALAVLEDLEDRRGLTEFTLLRIETLLALGRFEEAGVGLGQVQADLGAGSQYEQLAEALRLRAELDAATGGGDVAGNLDRAARAAKRGDGVLAPHRVALSAARFDLGAGRPDRATAAADAVVGAARRIGHVALELEALEVRSRAQLAAGRAALASEGLAEALARTDTLGVYGRTSEILDLAAAASDLLGRRDEAERFRLQAAEERRRLAAETPAEAIFEGAGGKA